MNCFAKICLPAFAALLCACSSADSSERQSARADSPRQTAVVSFTKNGGGVVSRTFELEPQPDGAARLVVPADSVPTDAKLFDIVHCAFTAKKGESGFWLFPRGEYGQFDSDNGVFTFKSLIMPFYGMQTPRGTYIGLVKGFRFGLFTRVSAEKGNYKLSLRSDLYKTAGVKPYEDIVVDYYRLDGEDANYSGIARFYRNYQLSRGACKPLKDRFAERPDLRYQVDSIPVRIQYHAAKQKPAGGKKEHYTPADEPPMKVYLSFADSVKFVRAIKDVGVDKITFCSAGWQSGGYDGRFPDIFPIDAELGGEEGLKAFTKAVRDMGYLISAHTNSTDCYSCSRLWTEDMVCRNSDGSLAKNGIWCGGRAYNLCLKYAWDNFLPKQIDEMGRLGFTAPHYIDVFSAVNPYACYNPKHAVNPKEAAEYQNKIAQKCIDVFGGFASESGFDHIIDKLDYCNYVGNRIQYEGTKPLIKRVLPIWEIVYHGIVLYNPDRYTQQYISGDKRKVLRLMEFGGRPIIYTNKFASIPKIAALYELYKPVRHLQTEFIYSHSELSDGVYLTKYENGAETVCNYSPKPFAYRGETVAPLDYKLFEK